MKDGTNVLSIALANKQLQEVLITSSLISR